MKLVVAGKGGSGKTSISGTLARLLARSGSRVLAIDADANPNLSLTLGIPSDRFNALPTLPSGLLLRDEEARVLRLTHPLEEICESYAVAGPDGVRLLVMAQPQQAGTGCLSLMHVTVRTIIEAAGDGLQDVCITDTEASVEHLSRATARYADAMLIVVEPYCTSLETGRRTAALALDLGVPEIALVVNKIRDDSDEARAREFAERHGLELAGLIPFDTVMMVAERAGIAPFDQDPEAPMVTAVAELGRSLLDGARLSLRR